MLVCQDIERVSGSAYVDPGFRADVLAGMAAWRPEIPARWFYDQRGSELFEQITELPEYYPTRAERSILAENADEIAELTGLGRVVVEFGSGSSSKTRILLSAVAPSAYVPIDISGEFLRDSADNLAKTFPSLAIHPIEGDFLQPLEMPETVDNFPRLGFFPGSTIGNLLVPAAVELLRGMAATLRSDGMLLIGIDRVKDLDILVPAYDDAQGVTAEFNMNLLHRINRELKGTVPVEKFRHMARWNAVATRIEMHLEATCDVHFTIEDQAFSMKAGETIHTENSHKYSPLNAEILLRRGGWAPIADWTDKDNLFSLILAKVENDTARR